MDDVRKVALPNEILFDGVKELVMEGHCVTFRVKGSSMNPFLIDDRDEAVISPFGKKDIVPGTVVLAKDVSGRIILHRVIAVEGEQVTMMGDGNCFGTETTDFDHVAGVVIEVIRNGKRMSCRSGVWRTASFFWNVLKPLRRWLLAVWRRVLRKI